MISQIYFASTQNSMQQLILLFRINNIFGTIISYVCKAGKKIKRIKND